MTVRRLIIAVPAVLLVAGAIGLLVPVTASKGDGGSVSCGSGLAADPSAAGNANDSNGANIPIPNQVIPHTDVVAQCQSAVSRRGMWAIPLAVIGAGGMAGAVLARRSEGAAASV
ncbi:hypothetical protein NJB1604_26780 [Mycobacterium marinum]|uniref:aminopeptidase n=1 Tax=Mycobacterium marinum TaxID=1781 RepID=UPI0021C4B8CE|nr:aminopeptidase [Mycobacterium marinum]GJO46544.1 hypothetical protein NJB1604_26780 [Mycobacterium marinum]